MENPITDDQDDLMKSWGFKYTRDQLRPIFELVEDKKNWKNPINTTLDLTGKTPEECQVLIEQIIEAVQFFAGCAPTIRFIRPMLSVKAVGYRVAVGA